MPCTIAVLQLMTKMMAMFKKLKDPIELHGHIRIRAWEKCPLGIHECLVYDKRFHNLIVNVGKDSILKYISGPTLACCTDSGYADEIGVGDSATAAAACQTDLLGCPNKLWKTISTTDKVYVRPTTFLSVDFGYSCANFTWNELGIRDNNDNLWARQIDCTPLVKTASKRAIIEWQISI